MIRFFLAGLEGLRFLWCHRRAKPSYVRWRLGTLYGSFGPSGEERGAKELLRVLWSDRKGVVDYLLWRREMRTMRRGAR